MPAGHDNISLWWPLAACGKHPRQAGGQYWHAFNSIRLLLLAHLFYLNLFVSTSQPEKSLWDEKVELLFENRGKAFMSRIKTSKTNPSCHSEGLQRTVTGHGKLCSSHLLDFHSSTIKKVLKYFLNAMVMDSFSFCGTSPAQPCRRGLLALLSFPWLKTISKLELDGLPVYLPWTALSTHISLVSVFKGTISSFFLLQHCLRDFLPLHHSFGCVSTVVCGV